MIEISPRSKTLILLRLNTVYKKAEQIVIFIKKEGMKLNQNQVKTENYKSKDNTNIKNNLGYC